MAEFRKRALFVMFNSGGHPVGALSLEPDSGTERLIPMLEIALTPLGFTFQERDDMGWLCVPIGAIPAVSEAMTAYLKEMGVLS